MTSQVDELLPQDAAGETQIQNYTINFPSIRPRMACCGWSWNWTAKSSSASIRMSACSIAAPRN
jgi:hypothetical protein